MTISQVDILGGPVPRDSPRQPRLVPPLGRGGAVPRGFGTESPSVSRRDSLVSPLPFGRGTDGDRICGEMTWWHRGRGVPGTLHGDTRQGGRLGPGRGGSVWKPHQTPSRTTPTTSSTPTPGPPLSHRRRSD